jgi:hypothetical protein
MSYFIKLFSVGAELFHEDGRTDRRTDMTKLIVAFRNFASAPKNATLHKVHRSIEACGIYLGLSLAKTV